MDETDGHPNRSQNKNRNGDMTADLRNAFLWDRQPGRAATCVFTGG